MADDELVFNGINANTGGYLIEPLRAGILGKIAAGVKLDEAELAELKSKARGPEDHFGAVAGIDLKDLAQAGWGVVFPYAKDGTPEAAHQAAVREALAPLMGHRRAQASGNNERFFKDYVGPAGYRPGESKGRFLSRHDAGPGPANPEKVPYYLLLVGSPVEIPYVVQYQLDVQYAVGRIHFDTIAEYASYAESVVKAETEGLSLARRAAFFGVANADDPATQSSASRLVGPLADHMTADQEQHGWTVDRYLAGDATKARLASLLGGSETPALLFTASHGMGFDNGDPRQLSEQGGLVCQNWPGPSARKPISRDCYLTGEDLGADARVLGQVAFFFACYGAGSPQHDEFSRSKVNAGRAEIAPHPFVARLPQRMLGHPAGGALAVVGHVERAWGCSFSWDGKTQRDVFESALTQLAIGHTVGSAMEFFNQRYSEIASDLTVQIQEMEFNEDPSLVEELGRMWTANNDARGYAIIGDPAVKLPVAAVGGAGKDRAAIEITSAARFPAATTPVPVAAVPVATAVPVAKPGSAATVASALSTSGVGDDYLEFGLFSRGKDGEPSSLQKFANRILATLEKAIDDARTVEVKTYVVNDMAKAEAGRVSEVGTLRAFTRIGLDGNVEAAIPATITEADQALLALHKEMVEQAIKQRKEMLTAALTTVAGLGKLLR